MEIVHRSLCKKLCTSCRRYFEMYFSEMEWLRCDATNDKAAFAQVAVVAKKAMSHFLCQRWSTDFRHIWVTKSHLNRIGILKEAQHKLATLILLSDLVPQSHHLFRWRLVAWLPPHHYLSQCWHIVDWTPGNIFQWHYHLNSNNFLQQKWIRNYHLQNIGHFVGLQCL